MCRGPTKLSEFSTRETLFRLAFGTEALIPLEVGLPWLRVEKFNEESNLDDLRANLDLLKEMRE